MEQNKDQSGAAVRGEAVAESSTMRFRKKPVEIEAIQWTGKLSCLDAFNIPELHQSLGSNNVGIPTLEGTMIAHVGDWIIKGVKGEFYPCKPDIFELTYVSARAADAPSEPSEPQQKTIDCMDAWAASMQMPTYSELQALTEQYDALIRKICFQYAAGGYNSGGFMAPKSADLKLRWIIDEAYKSPSRAADAPSEPSERRQLTDDEIYNWAEGCQFSHKGNPHKMTFSRGRFIDAVRTILSHSPAHRAGAALDSQPTDLHRVLVIAEAALADIGDADREPGDDVAWCEARAAKALPTVRAAIAKLASSQPTDGDGCAECRHTYCMSGEVCKACGDVAMQGWKGGHQPTDGGVRNG